MPAWSIQVTTVPEGLRVSRREADQLWYGPSRLVEARTEQGTVGAVRFAMRQDRPDRGLITDLMVEVPHDQQGLPAELIRRADAELKALGVRHISALVRDGQQLTTPFFDAGYVPFRKTVVLGWDLKAWQSKALDAQWTIDVVDRIHPEEIAEFIFASYQPYWQWWKETDQDAPLGRVEYPADQPTAMLFMGKQRNWARVVERLRQFNTDTVQRLAIARRGGRIAGLCDVKADADDSMDWGVLIDRDAGGGAIGSALLNVTLQWLKNQGLTSAQVTTASGLDDYDPTVYLYVLKGGAQIRGEFLILRKTSQI